MSADEIAFMMFDGDEEEESDDETPTEQRADVSIRFRVIEALVLLASIIVLFHLFAWL